MSTLSQFSGGAPTTSIVNAYSSGGVSPSSTNINASPATNGAKEVLSGALTANTLATVLSVSGGGVCNWLSAYSMDTTTRTVRVRVVADGVAVFDATSNAVSLASRGIPVVGVFSNTGEIRFNSSLVVQVASSLTETDKVAIGYVLNKR